MRTPPDSRTGTVTGGSLPAATAPATVQPVLADRATALPFPPDVTYRRLRRAGFTAREAGTLVGHLAGLRAVPSGWAIEEVERLLFVRALVTTGRMGS